VRRLPLDDLHALLRGELHSTVDIMLQRKQTMAVYGVKVQRHRPHEYPEPPAQKPDLLASVQQAQAHMGLDPEWNARLAALEVPPLLSPLLCASFTLAV